MTPATKQQPNPTHGGESVTDWLLSFMERDHPAYHAILADDIKARRQLGIERYGVELETHNGRSALTDGFQEAIDLMKYVAQALMERKRWHGGLVILGLAVSLAFLIKQELSFEEAQKARGLG
jgi:hypothetical protein